MYTKAVHTASNYTKTFLQKVTARTQKGWKVYNNNPLITMILHNLVLKYYSVTKMTVPKW